MAARTVVGKAARKIISESNDAALFENAVAQITIAEATADIEAEIETEANQGETITLSDTVIEDEELTVSQVMTSLVEKCKDTEELKILWDINEDEIKRDIDSVKIIKVFNEAKRKFQNNIITTSQPEPTSEQQPELAPEPEQPAQTTNCPF
jgi:hypothetical protein